MELLAKAGVEIPEHVLATGALNEYAAGARYPGIAESVTREEYLESIAQARSVQVWVESNL